MIIIQKNYSGGNGRGTLEYNLNKSDEGSYSHAIAHKPKDPYLEKEEYLRMRTEEELSKPEEVIEENEIILKPGQKDPRILDLNPAGIATAKTRVRVPKTIENPVSETVEFNPQADIQEEAPEEIKAGMSSAAKAGLIGAGVTALGAGGYAAYKALKRRKAKRNAIDAEVDAFLEDKYKTKKSK
jgi:hypothetical protein